MTSVHRGNDHFSRLPPELFIPIAALYLNSSDHASLSKVSQRFRSFMKFNYRAINNLAVLERFPDEAEFLRCKLIDGWISPTHHGLLELQKRVEDVCKAEIEFVTGTSVRDWELSYKIASPGGPQFLFMLENGLVISRKHSDQLWELGPRKFHDEDAYNSTKLWLGSLCNSMMALQEYQLDVRRESFKDTNSPIREAQWLKARSECLGVSPTVLGSCLQVLNCTSRKLQPLEEWMVAHLHSEFEARPKHAIAWYFGVPTWYHSKPMDETWNKWYHVQDTEKKMCALEERNKSWEQQQVTKPFLDRDVISWDYDKLCLGNTYIWFTPSRDSFVSLKQY